MSFATYSDLQAAIIGQLHRNDLSTVVTDWIALCEADFNKRLRITAMENRTTFTIDSEYEDVPTGFREMRNLQLNTNPVIVLTYMSPQDIDKRYAGVVGQPKHYAMVAGQIQFAPPPDGSYTGEIDYYKALDPLSASATTNWMLTNNPDVYFYGSLLHSAPYIQNDRRMSVWETLYERALVRVEAEDKHKIQSGSMMEMRSDIIAGDIR